MWEEQLKGFLFLEIYSDYLLVQRFLHTFLENVSFIFPLGKMCTYLQRSYLHMNLWTYTFETIEESSFFNIFPYFQK